MVISSVLAVFIAYILGSIPSGYLVARLVKGVDIRELGDHATGASNVSREIGMGAGIATAIGDMAKGAMPMLLAQALQVPDIALIFVALAAVSGHNWSIFLRFRGGAGLATTIGVLFAALPREALILVVPYALLGATVGRRIGQGETGLILLVPLMALSWWLGEPPALIILPVVLGVLIGGYKYWHQIAEGIKR
ncbi:MAG: glycerol-3-phosphate acyltransferase [Chloroflexi bacterium]|nr:glycerol-3-phosphate acyltransferase [Chloroflexota bacterium]